MTRQFFEEKFFAAYHAISNDKVTSLRMDFAKSLPQMKPYIDAKPELNT